MTCCASAGGRSAWPMETLAGSSRSASHGPGSPVPDRPHGQVPVRRPAQIPRLVHNPRGVLTRIDRLTALAAAFNPGPDPLDAGEKLRLVVERGHHHMPPLPPLRVMAVVAGDEALDRVVPGVHSRHRSTVSPATGIITRGIRRPGQAPNPESRPASRRRHRSSEADPWHICDPRHQDRPGCPVPGPCPAVLTALPGSRRAGGHGLTHARYRIGPTHVASLLPQPAYAGQTIGHM